MSNNPLKSEKIRIDELVVLRGLAESREKAKRLIMAGAILINGEKAQKPGKLINKDSSLSREKEGFVGRGGEKMEGFFLDYPFDVSGKTCLDIGASTGGFTDCLLKRGAAKVFAVDVGRGLIDFRLRSDPRVVLLEEVNARYITQEHVPCPCDLCVMDVSFISVEKIIPSLYNLITSDGFLLVLVKPQFEAGRENVGKKGVVKNPEVQQQVLERIAAFTEGQGFRKTALFPSRVKGAKGNQEFFIFFRKQPKHEKVRDPLQ